MPRTSASPPHHQSSSYRPDDRRRLRSRSPDSRPRRRSRSRSPDRNPHHSYSPRRSPRPRSSDRAPPLSYDERPCHPLPDEAPPLPDGAPPPLPSEAPPTDPPSYTAGAPGTGTAPAQPNAPPDDGWEPVWEASASAYYFYNRFTGATQWENPRVPADASAAAAPPPEEQPLTIKPAAEGGYNPAIHGSYATYAQQNPDEDELPSPDLAAADGTQVNSTAAQPGDEYASTATFNRFTGKFQAPDKNPAQHSDEAKAARQMGAFFDVDAAMNRHEGRSLRAERQQRRLTKEELKAYRQRAKAKKEQKARGWLMD